jgi:hypothetical protein
MGIAMQLLKGMINAANDFSIGNAAKLHLRFFQTQMEHFKTTAQDFIPKIISFVTYMQCFPGFNSSRIIAQCN